MSTNDQDSLRDSIANARKIARGLLKNDQVSFRDPTIGDAQETALRGARYLLRNHQRSLRHFTRARFRFDDGCNDVVWIGMAMDDTQCNVGIGRNDGVPHNACDDAGRKAGVRRNAGVGVRYNIGDVG